MGVLINGEWKVEVVNPKTTDGEFNRQASVFRSHLSSDSAARFAAESGRYILYVSHACPWAHRAVIFRHLKSLQDHIPLMVVHPVMGPSGWSFNLADGVIPDTVNHCLYLKDLYVMADPDYTGRVTVPILWDTVHKTIVSNESADIIRMFNSAFNHITGNSDDFYPAEKRSLIDKVNDFVYHHINNGVYKTGFATTQIAYEKNVDQLFKALDEIESLLENTPFLTGQSVTEADWRLFTTLVRFDAVYYGHFKCNIKHIWDYKHIDIFMKRLISWPGIRETINMDHIQTHYYASHTNINPSAIVPVGPALSWLN